MRKNVRRVIAVALLAAPLGCFADSSYQHSSQITGGQLINSIKNIPFMSKQMKSLTDPTTETTMVHGNQKAIVGKDYAEIWDLDKETITHVDNAKKTYSVMTFADMRKVIEEMPARMAQMQAQLQQQQAQAQKQQQGTAVAPNLQFKFTTDVKDTGLTKMIDSYSAKQQILTMKMIVTDTNNPGTNITYDFTDEIWTTPTLPAEMKDAQDFDVRFGKKLMQGTEVKDLMGNMASMRNGSQSAMMQMFGAKPGAADAFAQMEKELAKITGTRLVEITRMGGSGTGIDTQQGSAGNGPTANGSQGSNNNSANNSTTNVGSPGSMLGGALIGAFHKKKAQDNPPPASTPPAGGAPGQPQDVTLMEMTVQTHDFSSSPVPMTAFQVPAGFKQVPSPMDQMMQK
jgi:hypothetical protein